MTRILVLVLYTTFTAYSLYPLLYYGVEVTWQLCSTSVPCIRIVFRCKVPTSKLAFTESNFGSIRIQRLAVRGGILQLIKYRTVSCCYLYCRRFLRHGTRIRYEDNDTIRKYNTKIQYNSILDEYLYIDS